MQVASSSSLLLRDAGVPCPGTAGHWVLDPALLGTGAISLAEGKSAMEVSNGTAGKAEATR